MAIHETSMSMETNRIQGMEMDREVSLILSLPLLREYGWFLIRKG